MDTSEDVDETVRRTHRGRDDRAFVEARRRKRKRMPGLPAVPDDGSCCERCRSWEAPADDDAYGVCGWLGVLKERMPPTTLESKGIDKGTILTSEEARQRLLVTEPLRTAPGFACSRFKEAA